MVGLIRGWLLVYECLLWKNKTEEINLSRAMTIFEEDSLLGLRTE